jgi:vancomycin permeability regulator SanA
MTNGAPLGSHAILVFGAAVDHDGRPHRPLTLRLHRALAEAVADPRAVVIVSGGRVHGRPAEAPVMREWLLTRGLDAARIVVEPEARSTYENARHCADLIAGQGVRRVTLVTERYHVLRSRLLLARALAARRLRVEVRISAAPDHLGFFERITRCFKELKKLAADLWSP